MTRGGSVEIIENFWAQVWQSRNSHAVDKLIAEDFTITSGGVDIPSHAEFNKMGLRIPFVDQRFPI